MIKKVPQLKKGSTIAVLSPSWGGPGSFPLVYKAGIENLKKYFALNKSINNYVLLIYHRMR